MGGEEMAPGRQGRRGGPVPDGQPPVTIPRGAYLALAVAAVLLGGAAVVRSTRGVATVEESDLTNFFLRSANNILAGHPFAIYAIHPPDGFPNDSPPLIMFLLAPLLALARMVGFAATTGQQITFVSIPFLLLVPALGYLTLVALRQLFPEISETQQILAFGLVLFSPLIWQSYTAWSHLDQPLMLLFLVAAIVAFQRRREGLGGVLAGLALLSRSTAMFPLLAFGLLILFTREWRGLLRFCCVAVGIALAGLSPFFLFDRRDAVYSLVTWRGGSPIGGNSIWSVFLYEGTQAQSPLRYALDHLVRRLDTPTIFVFIALFVFLAVRRLRASPYGPEAWAIVTVGAIALPLLTKRNWPYYYLEPFIFLLIWEFATMHDRRAGLWRWPVLTFGYLSVTTTLSQFIGLQSVGALDRVAVGIVNFGLLLAFVFAIWARSAARQESGRLAPALAGRGPVAGVARQAPLPETRPAWGGAGSPPGAMPPGAIGWPSGPSSQQWSGPPGPGGPPPAGAVRPPGAPGPRTPWPPNAGGPPRSGG